jgi:hypothetical protein
MDHVHCVGQVPRQVLYICRSTEASFFMCLCPSYYTYHIHAHYPNMSIFVHGLEFSGPFNLVDGLIFYWV